MADRPLAETQLDEAIDRAVREMMNVEPRGDLRARVLAELGGPPARVSLWPRLAFASVALVAAIAVLTTTVRRPSDQPHVPRVATSQPPRLRPGNPTPATPPRTTDLPGAAHGYHSIEGQGFATLEHRVCRPATCSCQSVDSGGLDRHSIDASAPVSAVRPIDPIEARN